MRKLPTLIAYTFIALTLTRVADYVAYMFKAGWLAWIFSIGLGVAVYLSSYFTRRTQQEEKTPARNRRYIAMLSLVLFILADGYFNLVEVLRTASVVSGWQNIGIWIYGLFPTVAAFLMGLLQGYIDRDQIAPKHFSLKAFVRSLKNGRLSNALIVELLSSVVQAGDSTDDSQDDSTEPVTSKTGKKKKAVSKLPVTDEQLVSQWQIDPYASDAQVADQLGLTRSAVQQRRVKLASAGRIVITRDDKRRRIDIVSYAETKESVNV